MPSYLSRIKPNGEQGPEYKLKDEEIREVVQNIQTNKADKSDVTETDTPNNTPFLYRKTPYEADRVFLDELVGADVVKNQLVKNGDFSNGATGWGSDVADRTANNNVLTVTFTTAFNTTSPILVPNNNSDSGQKVGHKYYISFDYKLPSTNNEMSSFLAGLRGAPDMPCQTANDWTNKTFVQNSTSSRGIFVLTTPSNKSSNVVGDVINLRNVFVIDLTQMFGTTIADYIYSLEQATEGSGIAWLKSHGFFTKDYYSYNAGELISVKTSGKKYVGFNQWDEEWELGNISTSNGSKVSSNTNIRSKNYIPVIGGETYYFKNYQLRMPACYDENKTFISAVDATAVGSNGWLLTMPENAKYMLFDMSNNYGTIYNHDICINLSKTEGTPKNGDYVPYEEHTYDISNIDLRGIPKLVNNELVYDGDTYESDGNVTRKYGIVDLGTLNWQYVTSRNSPFFISSDIPAKMDTNGVACITSYENNTALTADDIWNGNKEGIAVGVSGISSIYKVVIRNLSYTDVTTFKNSLSGKKLVYELATPTTETTDPFTNPQICDKDGTEEFIDNRDFPVPVGHNSTYANLPSMMDGEYVEYLVDKVENFDADIEAIEKDIKSTKTATGNPITLTDGSETYAQGLVVGLEPKQDLHGYDFPWVGGAGKNKVDISDTNVTSQTTLGVETLPAGTYVASATVKNNGTIAGTFKINTTSATIAAGIIQGASATNRISTESFTLSESTEIRLVVSGTASGYNYDISQVQVEVGTQATSFAPYSNICPISGYEGVEVEDVGDNLYIGSPSFDDFEQLTGNWTLQTEKYNGHDVYKRSDVWGGCYKLINLPVGTYTFSVMAKTNDGGRIYLYPLLQNVTTASVTPAQAYFDTSTSWHRYYYTFNVTVEGAVAFRVERATSGDVYISEYQLEKGTKTPTEYHPYQSRTASVTFGQTVYGGRSNFTDGGTDDEYILEDIGNVTWLYNSQYDYFYATFSAYSGRDNKFISSCYKNGGAKSDANMQNADIGAYNWGKVIKIKDKRYADATAFKTALTGQTICYEKATPTTISTPPTDLKLLQDTNNLTTNGTTITLDYIPNNSIGDAVKASEEYTDRRIAELYKMIEELQQNS